MHKKRLWSLSITALFLVSIISGCLDGDNSQENSNDKWLDPITEVENCENCTGQDANHQHTDIMQHFLQTHNVTLIDYHNLNCDGKKGLMMML